MKIVDEVYTLDPWDMLQRMFFYIVCTSAFRRAATAT
jgi:hypothetical protein